MPEPWTGELIGDMHNNGITYDDVACEMGVTKAYVSMILNGKRSPAGISERMGKAVDNIKDRKQAEERAGA